MEVAQSLVNQGVGAYALVHQTTIYQCLANEVSALLPEVSVLLPETRPGGPHWILLRLVLQRSGMDLSLAQNPEAAAQGDSNSFYSHVVGIVRDSFPASSYKDQHTRHVDFCKFPLQNSDVSHVSVLRLPSYASASAQL